MAKRSISIEEVDNGYLVRISEARSGDLYEDENPEIVVKDPNDIRVSVEKWLNKSSADIGSTLLTRGE